MCQSMLPMLMYSGVLPGAHVESAPCDHVLPALHGVCLPLQRLHTTFRYKQLLLQPVLHSGMLKILLSCHITLVLNEIALKARMYQCTSKTCVRETCTIPMTFQVYNNFFHFLLNQIFVGFFSLQQVSTDRQRSGDVFSQRK